MSNDKRKPVDINSPYKASLTREQFLFYEMRTTAKLVCEGLDDEQVIARVLSDNLFQYPTEKSIRRQTLICLSRLKSLDDESLVQAIAAQPSDVSKQICLYAMMRHSRLVWDFMITVIGDKYRSMDFSFGKITMNAFMMRLQEQDSGVASWSDTTITKIKQVLVKILVENGYLNNVKSDTLNPVWLSPVLDNAIRSQGNEVALPAFNCFD
ncbi:MAG: DUF1819 domain-containing protein [Subdoligranulum variabile]|nr:MAG: DUF1819 domain-containing protein [Subdoligranulum variabile]